VRSGYSISHDGTRVLYRADQQVVDKLELFSVAIANPGVSTKMNSQLVVNGDVSSAFVFSPDSTHVAYVADQDVDGVLELYDTTVASPGVTAKLNGPLTAGGSICNFKFSPDSQRVAYCADQITDDVTELFTVEVSSPGAATKLSPALVSGGDVKAAYQFSADSTFMLYLADQEVDERVELFRVDIAAPGVATKMSDALVADGDVWDFKFRPDGTHAAYIATQDDFTVYELYEVAFATPTASTKLSAPMAGAGLWQFEYADDSASATYSAEQDSTAPELYRVGVATPGTATKLNGPIATGGGVWAFIVKAGESMTP
jgi:WD40 repeat protein